MSTNKTVPTAGADEKTKSIPQYFSWINNTNEGSTEEQTLVNLDFFAYMREKYGMQIRIYAWDAGNYDGASEGYGNVNGEKFRSQYPDGYGKIVSRAKELGIRLGLWGSPDGFGDDEETEKERFDFFVHLCRDYDFAEFKFDGVCGCLRPEKAHIFAEMMKECRKYSPDLVVLNHRLEYYEANPYITTFLWNGEETYTDVFAHNRITAMHNRAYTFTRGNVDGLCRLAEDHGVCLSSSLDYFEDDLVYQAFGRCLVLAPEIYGNPWFLKDEELPVLADIYNLHASVADILVDGLLLPESYGCNAVSRGTESHRFICTGNDNWTSKSIDIKIGKETGISVSGKYRIRTHFPYKEDIAVCEFGDTVKLSLPPFRATLIEILPDDGTELITCKQEKQKPPVFLNELKRIDFGKERGRQLYEAAVFNADNDSLEDRCIKRAGASEIPQVTAARDAFFNQKTYKLRGCRSSNMFDGKNNTFFDGQSKSYCNSFRIFGGCLRVDLGEVINADTVELICFAADYPTKEVPCNTIPANAQISKDLFDINCTPLGKIETVEDKTCEIVKFTVHTTYELKGKMLRVSYTVNNDFRYFMLPEPPDRIYSFRIFKDGKEIKINPKNANNLQASADRMPVKAVKAAEITIPDCDDGDYLAVAVNGKHGAEQVYCCIETEDELTGSPRRAPDYKANVWEHIVCNEDRNNTFFFDIPKEYRNKKATVYAVFLSDEADKCNCNVYFCPKHILKDTGSK